MADRTDAQSLENMTPNQRRALSKGLSALETMADLWSVEVRLTEMSERIAAVEDQAERAKRITALTHLGFVEGAYRHFLDHKDSQARAAAPQAEAAQGVALDGIEAFLRKCASECQRLSQIDTDMNYWDAGLRLVEAAEILRDMPECAAPSPDREQVGEAAEGCTPEFLDASIAQMNGLLDTLENDSNAEARKEARSAIHMFYQRALMTGIVKCSDCCGTPSYCSSVRRCTAQNAPPSRECGDAVVWETTHKAVCVPLTKDAAVAKQWHEAGYPVIEYFARECEERQSYRAKLDGTGCANCGFRLIEHDDGGCWCPTEANVGERQGFPERDPSKTSAEQGLYRKFDVRRMDGSDASGGKHHGCDYFVLDLDHDPHAASALRAYATSCANSHPRLSADLIARFGETGQQAALTPDEFNGAAPAAAIFTHGETMQQIQLPPLAEGEVYLRGFVNANGEVEHTILLPGDNDAASWQEQMDWAKSIGGDLPTRAELVIAYEQHRDLFKQAAYWSNTPDDDPEYSGWAWYQDFSYGTQGRTRQYYRFRARAVRRLSI